MTYQKNSEKGITLLEVIISILILSSITLITLISLKSYNNSFTMLNLSDKYYDEKLKISIGFNQILRYSDRSVFTYKLENNSFKIYDKDDVILEYIDNTFYNHNECSITKLNVIKDINLSVVNKYLINLLSSYHKLGAGIMWK